ncbi:PhaM family polyhydroxyalkanoate granule multifunctional regulatory protein [Bordetella sp. N]|uniref:PhaM family polyhydroxyalkanoate granule multifunctional regulatory protein n=1 Tax=Bordetella sp. N TaxID=1746199 RepID=UPI000A61124A
MTDPQNNPFILPGLGQSGDAAGNPLLASMEMMRKAWAGLMGPGGLAQVMPLAPPLNVEDLERRITELRSVESWLRLNLSMLSSTIQGLEVQRSTINTLRSFVDTVSSQTAAGTQWGDASPLEVVLGLKPGPQGWAPGMSKAKDAAPADKAPPPPPASAYAAGPRVEDEEEEPEEELPDTPPDHARDARAASAGAGIGSGAAAGSATAGAAPGANETADEKLAAAADKLAESGAAAESGVGATPGIPGMPGMPGMPSFLGGAAQSASEAWWNLLQQQFGQLASATAASMPGANAYSGAQPQEAAPAGAVDGVGLGKAKPPAQKSAPAKKAAKAAAAKTGKAGATKAGGTKAGGAKAGGGSKAAAVSGTKARTSTQAAGKAATSAARPAARKPLAKGAADGKPRNAVRSARSRRPLP